MPPPLCYSVGGRALHETVGIEALDYKVQVYGA